VAAQAVLSFVIYGFLALAFELGKRYSELGVSSTCDLKGLEANSVMGISPMPFGVFGTLQAPATNAIIELRFINTTIEYDVA